MLLKLQGDHRDAFLLLDETGWHVSELVRFVRGGAVEDMPSHALVGRDMRPSS
ncbi:MAG: hypothetical protein ACJ79W_08585 [Myxococcales bacterium]